MKKVLASVCIVFSMLFYSSILSAQNKWEVHLNMRGISDLVNGNGASFLVKSKIKDQKYLRIGLDGFYRSYTLSISQNNDKNYNLSPKIGIESRNTINDKISFIKGIDLNYTNSGFTIKRAPGIPVGVYTKQRTSILGLSPFLGIHFQATKSFAILTETHLSVSHQIDKGYSVDGTVDKSTTWETRLQPFQYLTICFTF